MHYLRQRRGKPMDAPLAGCSERKIPKELLQKVCEVCGEPFEIAGRRGRKSAEARKLCSVKCARRLQSIKAANSPPKTCTAAGCVKLRKALGLCPMHYERVKTYGVLDLPTHPSHSEIFWSHVAKGESCWEWTGAKHPAGYGNTSLH